MTIYTRTHVTAYYAANNAYNWAYQYLWSEGGPAIADVAAYKAAMGVYEEAGVAEPARSWFDAYNDAYRVSSERILWKTHRRSMGRRFGLRKITHAACAYADLATRGTASTANLNAYYRCYAQGIRRHWCRIRTSVFGNGPCGCESRVNKRLNRYLDEKRVAAAKREAERQAREAERQAHARHEGRRRAAYSQAKLAEWQAEEGEQRVMRAAEIASTEARNTRPVPIGRDGDRVFHHAFSPAWEMAERGEYLRLWDDPDWVNATLDAAVELYLAAEDARTRMSRYTAKEVLEELNWYLMKRIHGHAWATDAGLLYWQLSEKPPKEWGAYYDTARAIRCADAGEAAAREAATATARAYANLATQPDAWAAYIKARFYLNAVAEITYQAHFALRRLTDAEAEAAPEQARGAVGQGEGDWGQGGGPERGDA